MNTRDSLQRLQEAVRRDAESEARDDRMPRFYFMEAGDSFSVAYYGDPMEGTFAQVCEGLAEADVAPFLRTLSFTGPDVGANGTRHFDLSPLLSGDTVFEKLTTFFVEPTAPEHHNGSILGGDDYDEAGMAARLLTKAPQLESLTLPSAPNADFFAVGSATLTVLRVDSGYDHDFIRNLSRSETFPALRSLDFGEVTTLHNGEDTGLSTPFDDYRALLSSPSFAHARNLCVRNAVLTSEQWQALRQIRPDIGLKRIQTTSAWVR